MLQGKAGSVVTPMLPIFVHVDLHGSTSVVGVITSAYALAQLCSSAPLGVLMKRCHYTTAACLSLGVLICTALLSFGAQSVLMLFAIRVVGGSASCCFDLSRKTYLSAEVPNFVRGRVSSSLASMQKIAAMIAAALSGVFAQHLATRSIFLVQAAFSAGALSALLTYVCLNARAAAAAASEASSGSQGVNRTVVRQPAGSDGLGLRDVAKRHWRELLGAGIYCGLLSGCRNTWMLLLPLQAHRLGLSKQGIGLAVALVRGVDACVTMLAAGQLMDRYGKRASALPSMLLMSSAYLLIPLCQTPAAMVLAAMVYAVGNGLSGGIINALSSSLAPPHARTQFLGLWKMITSTGGLVLPPLFGLISDLSGSLELACVVVASVALGAVAWLLLILREGPPGGPGNQVPGERSQTRDLHMAVLSGS